MKGTPHQLEIMDAQSVKLERALNLVPRHKAFATMHRI
jgi:hypothetical protein